MFLIEIQYYIDIYIYIYIYIHMCTYNYLLYDYKECCCKYKSLNFIVGTDGKLLESVVKVI